MGSPKQIGKGIGLGVLMIVTFLALVYVFQYIWNLTIPAVFGLKEITYSQALGLIVISRILIGGFGFRWANAGKQKFWNERVKMKMQHMSDEEREEFKRKLSQRCKDW
jgi:hypothetical protein